MRDWLVRDPLPERWRHQATRANGQLAVGCYLFDAGTGRYAAAVIDVLTLDRGRIAAVTAFLTPGCPRRRGRPGPVRRSLPASGCPPSYRRPVFEHEVTVRWRDVDALGHVNHAVFLTYLEEGRDAFYTFALGADPITWWSGSKWTCGPKSATRTDG